MGYVTSYLKLSNEINCDIVVPEFGSCIYWTETYQKLCDANASIMTARCRGIVWQGYTV